MQLVKHGSYTTGSPVVLTDKSGISTLDLFLSTDVGIGVWITDETGLITQYLGFTRTLIGVSLEESTS